MLYLLSRDERNNPVGPPPIMITSYTFGGRFVSFFCAVDDATEGEEKKDEEAKQE